MRALAHPLRLSLLELLHELRTATATECAAEVGGSPQGCSYHLRVLARWGLIKRAESDDGRETRWQLAARAITFSGGPSSPAADAAAATLKATVLDRDRRLAEEFLVREHELSPEWRDAATFLTGGVYATADEVEELAQRVGELLRPYERPSPGDRPDEARRVNFMFRAIPKVGVSNGG
jgi:DNA-binding transcriptional ArsR family regulator